MNVEPGEHVVALEGELVSLFLEALLQKSSPVVTAQFECYGLVTRCAYAIDYGRDRSGRDP